MHAAEGAAAEDFPPARRRAGILRAICGGETTVLIEPQLFREALFLVGAGHCAQAIARLAVDCGLFVGVLDDRPEVLAAMPPAVRRETDLAAPEFIRQHRWLADEALVLVSRNHELDREALAAALETTGAGYIGMIGSRRKVRQVFAALQEQRDVAEETLARIYAPIGLDIGADPPTEIGVSVIAEILAVLSGEKMPGTCGITLPRRALSSKKSPSRRRAAEETSGTGPRTDLKQCNYLALDSARRMNNKQPRPVCIAIFNLVNYFP